MAPFQRKSSAASQQNLRPGFPPTAMFRRPSRSPFATCRGADAGRSSMSGFGSAHRAHRLLLRQRAEARWRCGSRSVTCGVVGDQVTLVAKLASRSRRAEGFRGEEVLDRRELPDALGCPGRALILELILVRLTILSVSFDLLAFESREMAARGRSKLGTKPILKNSRPSAFSTSSISRQALEHHDGVSVPMAAQSVRFPRMPALAFVWASELAGPLISPSLARLGP